MERTAEEEGRGAAAGVADATGAATGRPAGDAAAARDAAARAKARAYLDLWECHVVQTALYGPVAPWRATKS